MKKSKILTSRSISRGKAQKGFTLIETLVVMIVGIVILAAAAAGIGKLFRASEITEEAANLVQLRTQLDSLNSYGGYKGITNAVAIKFKAIPTNMSVKDNKISNIWGGDVVLGSAQSGRNVYIDYHKVPADACQQLVLKLANAGWAHININNQTISATPTLKDIGKRCEDGGDNNMVTFVTGNAKM
ncbi:type 4 pilus major pilin [Burkholderia sp. BCC0044]|uniref:type 4 pilus major pilin n=1 Tax=Burkholderia sp. BCC0044 TaxID=2676295 RepID=UPI00158C5890|nr:type 4 pilus major pilin [Burkholderia sp. BCC0044]